MLKTTRVKPSKSDAKKSAIEDSVFPEITVLNIFDKKYQSKLEAILESERSKRIFGLLATTVKGISAGWEPETNYCVMDFIDAYRKLYPDDELDDDADHPGNKITSFWLNGLKAVSDHPLFCGKIHHHVGFKTLERIDLSYDPIIANAMILLCRENGIKTQYTIKEILNSIDGMIRVNGHQNRCVMQAA